MSKREIALNAAKDLSDMLKEVSDDKDAFLTLLIGALSTIKRETYFLDLPERDEVELGAEKVATILIRQREERIKQRDRVSDEQLKKVIHAMACAFEKEKTE